LAFKGLVTTQDGKAVSDAYVLLHDYQAPGDGYKSENWEMRTQKDGSFALSVEPRCYDLFLSQGAMLPYSRRIFVQSSVLKIRLKPDPHPRLPIS
jgi:hypothetical protein